MARSNRKTRKLRGGARIGRENRNRISQAVGTIGDKKQIIHSLSQLKRFAICFKTGDTSRMLQFGYNLGRLQEMCGETTHPEVWWKPIETATTTGAWGDLESYIDEIREVLGVEYDKPTLEKGC